jgi:HEAT repeat protein
MRITLRWKSRRARVGWLAGGLVTIGLALPGAAAAELTALEIQQLSRFDAAAGFRDVPDWARPASAAEVQAAYQEVRALFAGRGRDVALQFLKDTRVPPSNGAYFFALEALADPDTALVLIHALADPVKATHLGILDRDNFQIDVAIESVLVDGAVRRDPRVISALMESIVKLRAKPYGAGLHDVAMVVTLLGRCAGADAASALQQLAADRDSTIRSTAIQALGQTSAGTANTQPVGQATAPLAMFGRALSFDAQPRARQEAATALGRLGDADGVALLRDALTTETHPQVVDAIVLALDQLQAPLVDPQQCREIASRTWEPEAARSPFACWRTSATPADLLDAATRGPAQVRALTLYALVELLVNERPRPTIVSVLPAIPRPSPGPPGARAAINAPQMFGRPQPPLPVPLDADVRARLLASAVEVLSRPSAASPETGAAISDATARRVLDALWQLAGRDMSVALRYADRISAPRTRHANGRFEASYALWNKDRTAYVRYRRSRQVLTAAALALALCVLFAAAPGRRLAAILVGAALTWLLATLGARTMRELPPPPLQFITVTAVACFSAGIVVAGLAFRAQRRAPDTKSRALLRGLAAVILAPLVAFLVCGVTRSNAFFPIESEGWELIFEPLGSAILAAVAAAALALLDGLIFRRITATTS